MDERQAMAPLPADLPEDWNIGQIIAPTGEEVGLSRQHGYNYLMEMVNKAQRGINQINAFLEKGGIGGGFVEMTESIPAKDRTDETLYGLILKEYGG